MRIGAQVPMAGGLLSALAYAVETGCETIQIFSKSPRRWAAPPLDELVCAAFREGCAAAGVGPVFCHGSYLINLGAEGEELWERSILALADELVRAGLVGASGMVLHLGRRFSDDEDESIARVVAGAVRAAELAGPGVPPLLLENSAGAGRQFGVGVGEMAAALVAVREAGVSAGICIDTCHALAGGIDVRTREAWSSMLDVFEREAGPGAITLIHANDCKGELGSHKDRHEWVGDGCVGEDGFRAMFEQAQLAGAAAVVEMPGEGPFKDEENVRRLKRLRDDVAASGGPGPATV
jgi:deoxyribonuclease IV